MRMRQEMEEELVSNIRALRKEREGGGGGGGFSALDPGAGRR